MTIKRFDGTAFDIVVPVLVAGGGACGLTAALAASDHGASVLVLERDSVPMGTTAMSSGLIPAAGTRAQRDGGVDDDSIAIHAEDIVAKTNGAVDRDRALHVAAASATTIDWLIDRHAIPLTLAPSAKSLPGHRRSRLHGTPNRTGSELIAALYAATQKAGVDVMTDARVSALVVDDGRRVRGVEITRPDGAVERIGCDALVLATCGFAGNAALVAEHIPDIAAAIAHTHPGNQGDALAWGTALGAATADLAGYQGHGSLAAGHGLLLQWIAMGEGGIQVNLNGERFTDDSHGYSEHAVEIIAQPGGVGWAIYDERIHRVLEDFNEYRELAKAGALRRGADAGALAAATGLPADRFASTMAAVAAMQRGEATDPFGRRFDPAKALVAPYIAVKVTGALFHTQGGLVIDGAARVLDHAGTPFPNLLAGGGAARGVSGATAAGYIAGNGLMTATAFGRLAGETAAAIAANAAQEILV